MKSLVAKYAIAVLAMVAVLSLLLVSKPAAQNKAAAGKPDTAATPRMVDGHPDLTGYWGGRGDGETPVTDILNSEAAAEPPGKHVINRSSTGDIFFDYAGANEAQLHQASQGELKNQPPYKPEYLAKVKAIAATAYGGTTALDPQMECKPSGVPRAAFGGVVVASPKMVAVLYEASPGPYYRIIYTDGRQHPPDLDTSFFGNSVGHWDGDTLVVDTVALNDETWLGGGQGTANTATIHSDKEHVIERVTRAGNTMTIDTTVEDPVMFTKPWVMNTRRIRLAPPDPDNFYLQPQMCVPNDKDHLIRETEKDKFLCGWCNPEALYGVDSDKITTGQSVPDALQDGLKTKIDSAKDAGK